LDIDTIVDLCGRYGHRLSPSLSSVDELPIHCLPKQRGGSGGLASETATSEFCQLPRLEARP
jgi:hypothetical protein